MEDWKEYTVQELIDKGMLAVPMDGNHGEKHPKTGDYVPTGVPFIMANNLIGGTVDLNNCAFISETQANSLDKGFAKPGDVLITHKATIGRTAIVPNDYDLIVLTPQVTYYRPIKGIDNRYLKYYFDTVQFQRLFKNWAGAGSTRAYLGITAQRKLPIILPDIGIQKRISSILKSLDDKIEVNRRINDNLEQQAQALFKSWFVDFEPFKNQPFVESELGMIPQGWKVEKLGDLDILVTDYVANGSFASLKENVKLYDTEEYAYFIRNTDLKANDYKVYVDRHSYDFLSKSRLDGGEIIISNVGDVGSVHLCPYLNKPMTLGNNIIMVKPRMDYLKYYLYILFRWSYGQDLIQSIKGGSAQPKFNKTDFKSLKIVLPDDESLKVFDNVSSSLFGIHIGNNKEIIRLAELRDTLLPRLMSGEMKVNEIKT